MAKPQAASGSWSGRTKSEARRTTPRLAASFTRAAIWRDWGIERPLAQCDTAALVTPQVSAISLRRSPAASRRLITLVWLMVTQRNRYAYGSQPHVTDALATLISPSPDVVPVPKSQPVRRTFDIPRAKAKMAAAGKSYADLARRLGYERQAVGHWFRGRGEPDVQQMKVIAEELGCHWLELVSDDTTVVFQESERERLRAIRSLSKEDLQELDAFLRFKLSAASGKETSE